MSRISLVVVLLFSMIYTKERYRSWAYVAADQSGRYYLKSEPRVQSPLTTVGYTTVYQVREHNDRELARYNWFCGDLSIYVEEDTVYVLCRDRIQAGIGIDSHDGDRPGPVITPYVSGQYYIKSIPKSTAEYSSIGYTIAYRVEQYADREIVRYNWYCRDLYLFSINDSLFAVRLNSTHQGTAANYSDVAVAFYHNERKIKEYSTLAIAYKAFNVLKGDFSYSVIAAAPELMFYDAPGPQECVFTIMTVDHRYLHFDVRTGEMLDE